MHELTKAYKALQSSKLVELMMLKQRRKKNGTVHCIGN